MNKKLQGKLIYEQVLSHEEVLTVGKGHEGFYPENRRHVVDLTPSRLGNEPRDTIIGMIEHLIYETNW